MSRKYCGGLSKKKKKTTSRPSGQTQSDTQTGYESYICSNIRRIYKCTHTSPTEPAQRRQKEHRLSSTLGGTDTHCKCLAKHFLFSRIKVFPCGWNMFTLGNLVSVTQMPRALQSGLNPKPSGCLHLFLLQKIIMTNKEIITLQPIITD